MPDIDWYGPEVGGPSSTGARVSYTVPVYKAVRGKALQIEHKARWNLERRPQHRTGDAQVKSLHWPTPGVNGTPNIDSFVYLTDPNNKEAAQGIENGHWQKVYPRTKHVDADGKVTYPRRPGPPNRVWVEGLHVIKDAADSF